MKKLIAVDIDDVLSSSVKEFVKFSNERWGTRLTEDDYEEDWVKVWGINKETARDRTKIVMNFAEHDKYEDIHGAYDVLSRLKVKYRLACVTARRRVLYTKTLDWINNKFPNLFEGVYFAGIWENKVGREASQETKTSSLMQIGADYLIDDQIKHCTSAAEAGIESLLFGNYAWNTIANLPGSVTKVHTWEEVGEYFGV